MKLLLPNLQLETPVGKLLVRITEKQRLIHEKLISSYFFFKFLLHISDGSSAAQRPLHPITGLCRRRCGRGRVTEPVRAEAQPEPSFLPRFIFLDRTPKFSPFHVPPFSALEPASR